MEGMEGEGEKTRPQPPQPPQSPPPPPTSTGIPVQLTADRVLVLTTAAGEEWRIAIEQTKKGKRGKVFPPRGGRIKRERRESRESRGKNVT